MAKTNAIFAMKINTFCVIIIFVIALCLGSNAQQAPQTPIFNISSIPGDTRDGWCQQQTSWCTNLCIDEQNTAETNDCNSDNLDYHCICSNGYKPNSTEYTLPIPYYICITNAATCKGACAVGNTGCIDGCSVSYGNCSATPSKHNITFSTSLPSSTSSSSGTSSPTSSPNILGSAASSINASFIVFLAVVFSMSIRF